MDTNLIIIFVVGILAGVGAELASRKRPNIRGVLAIVIAIIGAALGATLLSDFDKADSTNVPFVIIATILGALVLMIPWTILRGGYGPYGRKRTWRRRFEK